MFTCQDGRAYVNTGLLLHVKGQASGFMPSTGTGRVSLYMGHPQWAYNQGVWQAASNNGGSAVPEPASTGVFAGSTGDALDQTVTYLLGTPPSPLVPTGTPVVVAPAFTLAFEVRNETVIADFTSAGGGGISLPAGGPIFDLPAGCICNSTKMHIRNNYWQTTATHQQSWGRIKSLYR